MLFPNNTAADDEDFALLATANLVIPADGLYHLGFQGDDGSYLQVTSQTWNRIVFEQDARSDISGDRLVADFPTGNSRTIGEMMLTQGVYQVATVFFERGGGANYEVFGGPAIVATNVLPNTIPALVLLERNMVVVIPDTDGIQLVDPTPGSVLIVR